MSYVRSAPFIECIAFDEHFCIAFDRLNYLNFTIRFEQMARLFF